MYKVLILFLMITGIASLRAGSENNGQTGMAFLKVGVDARAAGMGEAYTAVSQDAYAAYWNPAGLMGAKQSNLGFMHNVWIFDVTGEFGAVQFAGKKSSLAFHVYNVNVGDIEVRDIPSVDPLEETSAHYISMGVSYARRLSPALDAGITAKYLFEKICVESATGYAFDLGVRYTGLGKHTALAASIQNLGSMNTLQNEKTSLPKLFRAGAMYTLPQSSGSLDLLFAADMVKPFEENLRIHLGTEATLWRQLVLRAGYQTGYESRSVSFGLGIRKSFFHFDYSYTPFQDDLGEGQRFSIFLLM